MNHPDEYKIAFTGLIQGEHQFRFEVGDAFFAEEEDAEILGAKVDVEVTLLREERMMDLHFGIRGRVKVDCDRCNEPMEVELEGTERLIIKLGERYYEESEDVQIIPESAHQVDLAPFLYEYIHLLLPARRVHPDDGQEGNRCNPDVLKKLEELHVHPAGDPRWDALKQLKEKDKDN